MVRVMCVSNGSSRSANHRRASECLSYQPRYLHKVRPSFRRRIGGSFGISHVHRSTCQVWAAGPESRLCWRVEREAGYLYSGVLLGR